MAIKKKKVIVTSQAKPRLKTESANSSSLAFGKENYKWILIGIFLIVVGMLLMIGGFNEDPAVWDESRIYGFQRTVLAPLAILSGLVVNIYALFK